MAYQSPLAPAPDTKNLTKRPHPSRQTQGYPRKRSMKACKTCRLRKTKCNNERPICAFCRSLGAVCDYEDEGDVSTLDPASQVIVFKLEELSAKVDESIRQGQQTREDLRTKLNEQFAISDYVPIKEEKSLKEQLNAISDENELFTPAFCTASDAISTWPILEENHDYREDAISSALFEEQFAAAIKVMNGEESNDTRIDALDQDAAPRLVEQYLNTMHAENPFIEVDKLRSAAVRIASNGFGWDASSCLVIIISALGALSSSHAQSSGAKTSKVLQSQALYHAARLRVGLLEPDLVSIQCLFFLGMYALYVSNPLSAWKWLTQASSFLLLHLKAKEAHTKKKVPTYSQSAEEKRLEASLYWSCYNMMSDLRAELPLPPSLLAEVDYPHVLPPVPKDFDATIGFDTQSPGIFAPYVARLPKFPPAYRATMSASVPAPAVQLGAEWLYYMADIILSRLKNRILRTLYTDGHESWNPNNLFHLLKSVNEFECKLTHWDKDLPPELRFDSNTYKQDNHLHHLTQSLLLTVQSILYTPMLYYLIHHSSTFPPPSFTARPLVAPDNFLHLPDMSSGEVEGQIKDFADKAIKAASGVIGLAREYGVGEWRLQRRLLSAVLVFSAAKLGGVHMTGREDLLQCYGSLEKLIPVLMKKEGFEESVDIKRGSAMIETLFENS